MGYWLGFRGVLIYALLIKQINGNLGQSETYTAAVVEYNAVSYPIHNNIAQNEQNFEKIMEEAKNKGAEIIVFPEFGLFSMNDEVDFTDVPEPDDRISPCDGEATIEAIQKLSCAARYYQIYTVFNIAEVVDCEKTFILECKDKRKLNFNTDIVFDRNGTIIARHRKYHRFAEDVDRPIALEVTYFDTDFGVRFGLLTCFEFVFENPGRTLVEDLNIKNIILLTAWSASLPYHIGTQLQFGWAYHHNVNLLVTGLNNPQTGSSGSGIFRGKHGVLENVISGEERTKLLVGRLYKEVDGPADIQSLEILDENISTNGLSVLGALEEGRHELILNGNFHKVLCHHELCCHFDVSFKDTNKIDLFRAYVFDGVADFQGMGTGGTQSCLVIACSDQTIDSCVGRSYSNATFNSLTISGNFRRNHALQIPSAIRHENAFSLMKATQFNHTTNCHDDICRNIITLLQPTSKIIIFGVYGRDYTKDGSPPDKKITDFERSRRIYRRRRRHLIMV